MTISMTCHECGSKMKRGSRSSTITYKGHSVEVSQPGWYCTKCDESVLTSEDIGATEPEFIKLKAHVEGVLDPETIRAVRKKLKLTQKKAGEILGGGPQAFQKYESGTSMTSVAMSNLLRLLAKDPRRLKELYARAS